MIHGALYLFIGLLLALFLNVLLFFRQEKSLIVIINQLKQRFTLNKILCGLNNLLVRYKNGPVSMQSFFRALKDNFTISQDQRGQPSAMCL